MEIADIKIYIGDKADTVLNNPLPSCISVFDPYIKWQLPNGIRQARFAIKITNIDNPQLVFIYKSATSKQQYQLPLNNGLNNKWMGLCFIQIQVSQFVEYQLGSQFQYTSGSSQENKNGYFVIDQQKDNVSVGSGLQYIWQKSIDQNVQQSLLYHLQVATHPLFDNTNLIINQVSIAGDQLSYVYYQSFELPVGTYFFRVRSFDGYDYSNWSIINAFTVKKYSPPVLKNLSFQLTENQSGDVIISFQTQCQEKNYTSVVLTFSTKDDLSLQYPCALRQTSHIVPVGKNQLIWMSANDIKVDDTFYLYAFAYCNGSYSETVTVPITLNNYKYSISDSTVSNINVKFNIQYYLQRLPQRVYYTYVGWNNQLYIHIDCTCTDCKYNRVTIDNTPYFRVGFIMNPIRTIYQYIGWNSQIEYKQKDKDGNFVYQIDKNMFVDQKYLQQNSVFNRICLSGGEDFSLYADGRNYCRIDKQDYVIQDQKSNFGGLDDISLNVSGGQDQKPKVLVKAPLQKAPSYDPIFNTKSKIPATSGVNKYNQKIQVLEKVNWVYSSPQLEWTFTAQIKCQWCDGSGHKNYKSCQNCNGSGRVQVYLLAWGGALQATGGGKDNNLKTIVQKGMSQRLYQQYCSIAGTFTLPDGKLQFQDNQTAPQYTMYPDSIDSSGYPVGISQKYWRYIDDTKMYIKKYHIEKGGDKEDGQYGYKDFKLQKNKNVFHRYFNNLSIPDRLYYNQIDFNFRDQFGQICYSKLEQNKFYLVSKKYEQLPLIVKFDTNQNNLVYQYWTLTYAIKDTSLHSGHSNQTELITQPIYYQQYIRIKKQKRGVSSDLESSCQKCEGSGNIKGQICDICKGKGKTALDKQGNLKPIKNSPFSNVAVPTYVPSKKAVFSSNKFNGRNSAFDLKFKVKRDKRRYVSGHYFKWGDREKDPTRLVVLNNFLNNFYSDYNFEDPKFDNIIIHYKYKYLDSQSVDKISQDNYIYVNVCHVGANGEQYYERAWFKDISYSKFSSVSANGSFNWKSIDDDDYICVYRHTDGMNINLSDSGFKELGKDRNIIVQGTKLSYDVIEKKNYYSDKSQYGIQSYNVQGDLSQLVTYSYNSQSKNQYLLLNRTIYLNHKNVIRSSVQVYYYDDFNKKTLINNYSFVQSNMYYNASIILKQKSDYVDRQVFVSYKYIITDIYTKDKIYSNVLNFADYQQTVYFQTSEIVKDTFEVKFPYYQQGQLRYQVLDPKYYFVDRQIITTGFDKDGNPIVQKLDTTEFRLLPLNYYDNLFVIDYMYRLPQKQKDIVYSIDGTIDNENDQVEYSDSYYINEDNKYVLTDINKDILKDSMILECIDSKNRYTQIDYTKDGIGSFTVAQNQNVIEKPIVINYSYNLLKNCNFQGQFSGFSTYLSKTYIDVDTIKIYYLLKLDDDIQYNITDYFNFYSEETVLCQQCKGTGYINDEICDNCHGKKHVLVKTPIDYPNENTTIGIKSNIRIQLNVTDYRRMNQIFDNVLYAKYNDNQVQQLFLMFPSIVNQDFLVGFNYNVYCLQNQQKIQIPENKYMITKNTMSLVVKNDYTQIVQYLNKTIVIQYQKNVKFSNKLDSIDFTKTIESNNSFLVLQNKNIVKQKFYPYYLNDQYGFSLIESSQYNLNQVNGQFQLLSEKYKNRPLMFCYKYIQYIYDYGNTTTSFKYVGQAYPINKNVLLDKLYAYIFDNYTNVGVFAVTNQNSVFDLMLDNVAVVYCQKLIVDFEKYTQLTQSQIDSLQTEVISQNDYTFDGSKLTFKNKLYNTIVRIKYIPKLIKDVDYQLNDKTFNFSIKTSSLIGSNIVISFTYLKNTVYHNVFNNVITDENSQVFITQQDIDNRTKNNDQFQQSFQSNNVLLSDIFDVRISYGYDYCRIFDYQYIENNDSQPPSSTVSIVINKPIEQISKYIKLKYSMLQQNSYSQKEYVRFNGSNEYKLLKHPYCYNAILTFSDGQTVVNELDYVVTFQQNSYLYFTNRFLNKQFFVSYDMFKTFDSDCIVSKCIVENGSFEIFLKQVDSSSYSDNSYSTFNQQFFINSVQMYYDGQTALQENGTYSGDVIYNNLQQLKSQNLAKLVSKQHYKIEKQADGYYIVFNQYADFYNGLWIFVFYQFKDIITNNTNQHIQYLTLQSYRNKIQFNHQKVTDYKLSYFQNGWKLIQSNKYNFVNGGVLQTQQQAIQYNASITMIQNSYTNRFFRKKLSLQYSVERQSQLKNVSFVNDRSLVFKDENGYVILQNGYIDKDTFVLYYQDNYGVKIVPKQAYLLDCGSDQHYAVVVLNKQYADYKKYIGKRLTVQYKYIKNPVKIFTQQNEKFPYLDFIFSTNTTSLVNYYVQGYSVSQHDAYWSRPQPTYIGGRGIKLVTNITQPLQYLDLKFLYLQSFWDAYNTIHMQGNLDGNAQIVLQYGQINNGIVEEKSFRDFVTFKSKYNSKINHYLLQPLTWDVFVDTFDDSLFLQGQIYVLRMRAYNVISNSFTSQWQYSNYFTIDHDSVNPVNITNIQYDPWTKKCMIQFRIDDTQGDYYDLISYAYTDDGSTWHTIQDSNIHGVKQWLVSNKKDALNIVTHQILWDTTGYSLTPSSTYRIKINATYTKYNQGDQPSFHWQATINPLIDYYQDELFVLNGGKQYYKKTREDFVKIQNKDGTVSYQQVQNPKQTWVKIQPYEYYFYDENGNKLYVQGGEYTQRNGKYYDQNNVLVMQIRDYAVVDGRLQDQQKKLQQVKGRPTKTIVQNGVSKTINWGYLQFCNQNGQLVDKTGYAKWLAQNDPVYGYKRSVVINQIQSEINDIKQKITYYKNKILQCQMKNRRQLIKQGFYSNGFLYNSYNQSDPTDFVFRLKSKPTTKLQSEFVKNQTGYGLYEIKYNLQLDFFDTFDSQYENKPLRDFYNYQVNNIVLDITAGVDKDDLENSNLYKGDFIINNDYLPGKQQFDYNPLKDVYSYQYFWRIRPYVSFQEAKKQVVFTKIKEITQDDNYVYMLFDVCGKSDLGTVQLQAIYYQTKTTDDNYIQLIEPVYQNDYYYHFYQPQKHLLNSQQSNVYFLTDRLRDQDGYLRQRKNSYLNWTSFTTNRQRPQVLIVDNQYYMFYDKKSSSGQNLIYLARSKNGTQFGEYSQIFPYLTFNKLKETELVSQNIFSQTSSSVSNPFVLRKENKFLVFADAKTKTILNENKNRILLFQSDYSGDIFETPVICNGIQGYICPSVFVISGMIEQKDENNQSVYTQKQFYIMACMKPYQNYISQNQSQNSFESDSSVNENTIIQFFVSEDRKTWSKTKELMDVDFGKYQTLLDNGIYNTDLIKYNSDYCLSPFVYKNEQQLWVYYCIYEGVFHSNSIYRVKYNFVSNTWSQPTFIINNAFNPTVVQDCYFGNNYHRLYYNTKIKTKLNGKDVDQIVVNNCFITNIKLQNEQGDFHYCQLNNVVVSSTQYSYASKNNIQVGYNQQCANCNATGYVYKNEQQIVCDKCNGNGIIQFIQYKLRIPKRNFQLNWEWDSTVDNYVEKDNAEYLNLNYILALKPKYDTKTYYQYGQWYDYNHANQFQRKIVPDRRWNYLQV